jgi:glycosyltransferase involved in cell wall biosynthesis
MLGLWQPHLPAVFRKITREPQPVSANGKSARDMNLLMFNLVTDANDPILWFSADWATRLARHFRSLTIVTMRAGQYEFPDNVRVFSLGKERGYSELRRLGLFYWHVGRILLTRRIDVCFAHQQPRFALLAAPLLYPARIGTVLWYAHGRVSWIVRLAERVVATIVTSSALGCRMPSAKIRVIGQGIDVARFSPDPRACRDTAGDNLRVLSLGRLSPIKHNEDLIVAFAELVRRHPWRSLHLRIVGDVARPEEAGYRDSLRELVAALGLVGRVTFVGAVTSDDVVDEYRNADVIVNVSETASMDKTVLEAMSCGTPVLSANSAYADILPEFDARLILRQRDPAQLAQLLEWFAQTEPAFRADLGRRLRAYVVREHGIDQLIARLVAELERCAPLDKP